ncbi:MAG TPA: hypothetical protein C5S37_01685 [Methanophagales archaeon]|nr:hypothetical protein [Methanophagales archaeon]
MQDTGCKMQSKEVCEEMEEMEMETKEKGELAMEMQDARRRCKIQDTRCRSALFPNPYSLFPYLVLVILFLIALAGIATAADDGVCCGATTNFTCGDTVFESCTLNGSMSCPTGHGLVVGDDGIVIDGNGYCVDGVSPGNCVPPRAGIYNYKYDNVVIKNIEVKNFCFGIRLKGYYSDPTDFDYVVNNTIDNCKVHDNGNPDGGASQGIDLYAASHCNVTNNEVYNNTGRVTGGCGDGGMGIRMHGENHPSLYAGYHTVTNNTVYGNRLSGIYSKMKSMYNYVAYNDVYENGELGQSFGGGIRLMCLMTNNWIIEYNNVTDNTGPGILVGGSNNIVRHNTVTGSKTAATHAWEKGHGINICRGSTNNTLTLNIVCENEDTDIAVIQSSFATGDENTCDTSYYYNDAGTTGCTYICGGAVVDFSAEPRKGVSPLEVEFTDESKPQENITSRMWNFGDENTTTTEEKNIAHTYNAAEPYNYYNVSLTVNWTGGETANETKTEYIRVWKPGAAPDADFSASPRKMAISPMTVDFTDMSLGDVTSWFWDFGDGGTSEEQKPTHEYTTGVYTVSLTVTGPGGSAKDTKTDYIVVNLPDTVPAQTDAHFFASTRSGAPPLEVAFTDMSRSEGEIDSWLWDFGDGNTSSEVNPMHTYSSAGCYNVSLEVTAGDAKANETKTGYITVSSEQPGICGDVNEDEGVNMLDVIDVLYYVSYPGEYGIGSAWAADVNCDDSINMLDVIDLLYYVSYPGEYELGCCGS